MYRTSSELITNCYNRLSYRIILKLRVRTITSNNTRCTDRVIERAVENSMCQDIYFSKHNSEHNTRIPHSGGIPLGPRCPVSLREQIM